MINKLLSACNATSQRVKELRDAMNNDFVGKKAKIVSNYNGQPHGSSKKSMKGKVVKISGFSIDYPHLWIWAEGLDLSFHPNELELIENDDSD